MDDGRTNPKCRTQVQYGTAKQYHVPNVRDINHAITPILRTKNVTSTTYRMSWVWDNKLIDVFVERVWIVTAPAAKTHHVMKQTF